MESLAVMKPVQPDPAAKRAQFDKDLEAMNVGRPSREQQKQRCKTFALAQFCNNRWATELQERQTLADAMDPTFWVDHAARIMQAANKGVGDIIEIRKPDVSLYAELFVIETGKGFIRTVLIREAKAAEVSVPETSPLSTRWNVGARAHEVMRSDGVVMASGFQTKAAAVAWITDHLAKMAA